MVTNGRHESPPTTFTGRGMLRGMRGLLPISIFVIPYGIAFGIAATEQGVGPFQATAMSFFVFTATVQFAALDFLPEPVPFISLGLVALALSGRHIIMGAALSKWINQLPIAKRATTLMLLSDANFADTQLSLQRGENDLGRLLGGGVMLWVTWIASTALGAFGGDMLGDTEAYGFGVVMPCFFAATVFGMARRSTKMVLPVLASMGIAALTFPLLPVGWNIILGAIIGGAVAVMRHAE